MTARAYNNEFRERDSGFWVSTALLKIRVALLTAAMLCVAMLSSCETTPRADSGGGAGGGTGEVDAPSYETIAARHNDRLDRMTAVYAVGSVDLRWTDDDGKHFETVHAKMWFVLPDRTAMDVGKLGERQMWLGSNGSATWMVDFSNDETVLYLYDASRDADRELAVRPPIQPHTLVKLFGLGRLPVGLPGPSPAATYDSQRQAWVVTVHEAKQVVRLYFDPDSLLPIRVELLSPDLVVLMHSTLSLGRYERVQVAGTVPGSQPRFPTLVDIVHADGSGSVKVAVRNPTDAVKEKYFELDWIKSAFDPDRIEGRLGPLPAP